MPALRTRRTAAAATAALLATLTLAGCGGSSSAGGSSSGTASATSEKRSAAELAADRKLAGQALMKLSDFPEGWKSTPSDNEDDDDELGNQLAECLNVPDSLLGSDEDDSVDSPDFESPDNQQVSNSVIVGASEDEAVQVFDILEQPNASKCLRDGIDKVLQKSMASDPSAPADLKLGTLTLGKLNLPQFADESVAFRATVPVSTSGANVDVNVDIIFMRHARAASFMTFLGVFSPFPTDDEKRYANIAADRLTGLDVQVPHDGLVKKLGADVADALMESA